MRKMILVILTLLLFGIYPVQAPADVWWENSHLEINDGEIYNGELFITDYGSVDMFGGIVGKLETWDYSTGNIYGGEIDILWTDNDTVINIYGGSLITLASRPDSTVYLYAYDTTYHLDSGLYNQPWLEGKYINTDIPFSFSFYGDDDFSQVIIVPEPATLVLLALGGLFLRSRKH